MVCRFVLCAATRATSIVSIPSHEVKQTTVEQSCYLQSHAENDCNDLRIIRFNVYDSNNKNRITMGKTQQHATLILLVVTNLIQEFTIQPRRSCLSTVQLL